MSFQGFASNESYTPVPNTMLGPLLEEISDIAELKVVLRVFWLLHRKKGGLRMATLDEFLNDLALLKALGANGRDPREEVRRGLDLAVERGVLLLRRSRGEQERYLLNTPHNRTALERMGAAGASTPGDGPEWDAPSPDWDEKPNIFTLYEENIGMLTPILAEELREAEDAYPQAWLREALAIAVTENKRSWRYIVGILRRWAAEGKNDGKPGRHPQTDNRQKYLDDYQRRWGRPAAGSPHQQAR